MTATDLSSYVPTELDNAERFAARQAERLAQAQGPSAVNRRLSRAYRARHLPATPDMHWWDVLVNGRCQRVLAATRAQVLARFPSATIAPAGNRLDKQA